MGRARSGRKLWVLVVVMTAAACTHVDTKDAAFKRSKLGVAVSPAPVSPLAPKTGFLSEPAGTKGETVDVWDWNGKKITTVTTRPPLGDNQTAFPTMLRLSADGTRVLVDTENFFSNQYAVMNLSSDTVAHGDGLGGTWAVDGLKLCAVRPLDPNAKVDLGGPNAFMSEPTPPGPAVLVVTDPGGGARVLNPGLAYTQEDDPYVLRCSADDDTAVIAHTDTTASHTIDVVSLRTGAKTTPKWEPPPTVTVVAFSGNGRYAAEAMRPPSGYDSGRIVDTRTGAVVAHLDGVPDGISWNGKYVVEELPKGGLGVVEWRTGHVRWNSPPLPGQTVQTSAHAIVAARPYTDDLALNISGGSIVTTGLSEGELFIVNDRTEPRLLTNVVNASVI